MVDRFASMPVGDVATQLPVDELAIRLLTYLIVSENIGQNQVVQPANVTNPGTWAGHNIGSEPRSFLEAIAEAWHWLATHDLIALRPGEAYGVHFVTRLGRVVAARPDALRYMRAQARLDVDLHPAIAGKVRPQFLLGDYETAAFAAMKEVEIRVRKLAKGSTSEIGVPLMRTAFGTNGPLRDPSMDGGEATAVMELFAGALGVIKNPTSHRQVEYNDLTEAAEAILLADLLHRLLDRVETRLQGAP